MAIEENDDGWFEWDGKDRPNGITEGLCLLPLPPRIFGEIPDPLTKAKPRSVRYIFSMCILRRLAVEETVRLEKISADINMIFPKIKATYSRVRQHAGDFTVGLSVWTENPPFRIYGEGEDATISRIDCTQKTLNWDLYRDLKPRPPRPEEK
jgi:hypothetical protein